jgi:hypothetical protein
MQEGCEKRNKKTGATTKRKKRITNAPREARICHSHRKDCPFFQKKPLDVHTSCAPKGILACGEAMS